MLRQDVDPIELADIPSGTMETLVVEVVLCSLVTIGFYPVRLASKVLVAGEVRLSWEAEQPSASQSRCCSSVLVQHS